MENRLPRIQFWLLVLIGILSSLNYSTVNNQREELKAIRAQIILMENQIAVLQRGPQVHISPSTSAPPTITE